MKKNLIKIISITLIIGIISLLFTQAKMFFDAAKVKEEILDNRIISALLEVSRDLEKFELNRNSTNSKQEINKCYSEDIYKNIENVFNNNFPRIPSDIYKELRQIQSINSNISRNREYNNNLYRALRQYSKLTYESELNLRKGLLSTINNFIPLKDRVDEKWLNSSIKANLNEEKIDVNYEYGVYDRNKLVFRSSKMPNIFKTKKKLYRVPLFQNQYYEKPYQLYLYLPNQTQYLIQSFKMVMPSALLIIIIAICSITTIIIILRQKKLSEIKNDFINNMTHELKTPIATISLASQMLKDNSVSNTASSVENISKIIHSESKRLTNQVEKVLQMAIFTESRLKLKLKNIDLHEIITKLINNLGIRFEEKGGHLQSELNASQFTLIADEVHISNVVTNLIDNAIKYCNTNPEVKISTKNVNDGIEISFKDNGIGISKENRKMIFERFYRVPTGNVHDVKGFGLGLSYVKRIIEAHKGNIKVDSVLNKGSEFKIWLPVKNL